MRIELEIDGQPFTVVVERYPRQSNRYRVSVDGAPVVVDAVRTGADTLSLILPDRGFASHDVGFARGDGPNDLTVHVLQRTLAVSVNGRRSRTAPRAGTAGEQRIVAPMPGKVLRVLVSAGAEIAARQPLLVVEAMKMENELSSPRPGRVKQVAVSAGQSVEAGRLLMVVE
jgi:biotin carboxyl carrier protein